MRDAILQCRRAWLEHWIEEAIDLLDTMDGDPDLEDDEIEDIDEREPACCFVQGGVGR